MSFGLYLIGFIVLIGGLAWAAVMLKVPPVWIGIGVVILVGLGIELLKYINLLIWPLLKDKLQKEYGPFYILVTIVLFSFIASMIVLAGAEWAAREAPPVQP